MSGFPRRTSKLTILFRLSVVPVGIWELLQNARDSASSETPLHIVVSITEKELTFQHNGMPFNMDQVAHLIHHGSTKYREEKQVGRFGTGFLSTHIISRLPRVSGRLVDGKRFTFVLDRTGTSPEELTDAMNRSSRAFVESIANDLVSPIDHTTRFDYSVHK